MYASAAEIEVGEGRELGEISKGPAGPRYEFLHGQSASYASSPGTTVCIRGFPFLAEARAKPDLNANDVTTSH